jgi:hypothetical protein
MVRVSNIPSDLVAMYARAEDVTVGFSGRDVKRLIERIVRLQEAERDVIDKYWPIINTIGEISKQEAYDAIIRIIGEGGYFVGERRTGARPRSQDAESWR